MSTTTIEKQSVASNTGSEDLIALDFNKTISQVNDPRLRHT